MSYTQHFVGQVSAAYNASFDSSASGYLTSVLSQTGFSRDDIELVITGQVTLDQLIPELGVKIEEIAERENMTTDEVCKIINETANALL